MCEKKSVALAFDETLKCVLSLRIWLAVAAALHEPGKERLFWLQNELQRNMWLEENVIRAKVLFWSMSKVASGFVC